MDDIMKFYADNMLIEEEYNRINPYPIEGEFQSMLKSDMKRHNVKLDTWGTHHYKVCIELFASDKGWLEEDCFTGMEVYE
jgi:hypothetical protein